MRIAFIVSLAGLISLAVPGLGQPAPGSAIGQLPLLQPGQWSLKSRKDPGQSRLLCLSDLRPLLQLRHGNAVCSRFIIASNARSATVQYSCPGAGQGRTTVKVETARLVQIESQGIMNNEPFALEFEGRRVGECVAVSSNSVRH